MSTDRGDLLSAPDGLASTALEKMLLIRTFDERAEYLKLRGAFRCSIFPAHGMEGVAVGVSSVLTNADTVSGQHRANHHALAKGMSPDLLMAELYGKATGICQGRSGAMHVADFSIGFVGANGIIGASVGIALGDAFAAHYRSEQRIAVAFIGDGAVNTGRTWEACNLAAAYKLPLLVVCENNLYANETASTEVTGGHSIVDRAAGFGLSSSAVDGQDITAVYRAAIEARERALNGEGPSFIEARTYRYKGHASGDDIGHFRTNEEITDWQSEHDPIERLRADLVERAALSDEQFAAMQQRSAAAVEQAITFAEESPWPE